MVAVDTNILVRVFTGDVPELQRRAEAMLQGADTLLVDRLILSEFNYVMQTYYKYSKADVAYLLTSLLQDSHFHVPDRALVEHTVRLFTTEKPLSFEDCWLLALQQTGKVESVATFDQNLQKRLKVA